MYTTCIFNMKFPFMCLVILLSCNKSYSLDILNINEYINFLKSLVNPGNPLLFSYLFKGVPRLTLNQLIPVVTPKQIAEYEAGVKTGDEDLSVEDLIKKYGYPLETHHVITEDGYNLTVFRIPNNGTAVFLEHGLDASSDGWFTLGPKKALGYLLANKGYDVWIGNARGNKYCLEHESFSPDDEEFWNFTFDEIARYDLPAIIDYALNVTGKEKLIYIGHSQGTTVFFILCSERPEYNKKIHYMVALSPIVFLGNSTSPVIRLGAPIVVDEHSKFRAVVGPKLGGNNKLMSLVCGGNIVQNIICASSLFLAFGIDSSQIDYEALPTIVSHVSGGASTKQLSHYAQWVVSGKFRRYDYGKRNQVVYGSDGPPDYELENISVPMALFHGNSDWVNVKKDLDKLLSHLKNNVTVHEIPYDDFVHADFLFAKDAYKLLYKKILRMLKVVDVEQ